jgi:hypothetical protein
VNPALPGSVDRLILQALEKQPDRRFRDAAHMLDALVDVSRDLGLSDQEFVALAQSVTVRAIRSSRAPDAPSDAEEGTNPSWPPEPPRPGSGETGT